MPEKKITNKEEEFNLAEILARIKRRRKKMREFFTKMHAKLDEEDRKLEEFFKKERRQK